MHRFLLAVTAVAALGAAPARAASFAVELHGGYRDLTGIHQTADALFDSRGGATFGGAIRVDLSPKWFVRAGADHLSKSGERVFVADPSGPVFRLGFPLDFSLTPAYGDVAYRFASASDLRAYVGASAGVAWAKETSTIAGEVDETSSTKFAARGLLGASYGRSHVQFGVELSYSIIPSSAGVSDVSQVYGEKDLGGFAATAILTLRP
jgi:hypothetical protein